MLPEGINYEKIGGCSLPLQRTLESSENFNASIAIEAWVLAMNLYLQFILVFT